MGGVSISVRIIKTLPNKLSSPQLQVQTTVVYESLLQNSLVLTTLKNDLVWILPRNAWLIDDLGCLDMQAP